ncbi:hypothetical protein ACA910_005126 [Epithemia clementina (nom. ined.)]
MTDGKRSTFITNSPTNSLWFKRFMDGCHECMGDVKIQDTALSIDVLLGLQEMCQQGWTHHQANLNETERFELVLTGCLITCKFSSGLRGQELGHIRLRDSILLTTQGLRHPRKPHVVSALEGRFKGQVARQKHKIPLVLQSKSRIANKTWLIRLFLQYKRVGVTMGPLFREKPTSLNPASARDLDYVFHHSLLRLQEEKPDLIPPSVDVINQYSTRRSLRRGSTTQARNKKVPREVIELNNRWRTEDNARLQAGSGGGMLNVYTDVLATLDTFLRYSEPL